MCGKSLKLKLFTDVVRNGDFTEKQLEGCGCIGDVLEQSKNTNVREFK